MTTQALTDRQHEVLDYIGQYTSEHGRSPTVREIGAHFGFRSPFGAQRHLKALQKKHAIERDPRVARGIRIVANHEQGAS
jgi:repressor LexA